MYHLHKLPVSLPDGGLPSEVDAETLGSELASTLPDLQPSSLAKDAVWRDLFALTGTSRTFYGDEVCSKRWAHFAPKSAIGGFGYKPESGRVVKLTGEIAWVECSYTFQAESDPKRDCVAVLSLVYNEGEWKIWVLRTILDKLRNHPDVDRYIAPPQALGATVSQTQKDGLSFDCVVIGAGQAGLSVAGRLAAQGVTYVVLEKNGAIGDNWRLRYKSTKCEKYHKVPTQTL